MKYKRRIIAYIIYIVLGVALFALGVMEIVDSFWSGMGGMLIAMGVIRMIQYLRLSKDDTYREKFELEVKDERNRFIRNKAWAWSGYLFVLISAVSCLIFKLAGQDLLSSAAASAVCLIVVLYWGSYMILRKKY